MPVIVQNARLPKTKCLYSYSTVCRHRNLYWTSTAEGDRKGSCQVDERSSRESRDVTFSGVFQPYQCGELFTTCMYSVLYMYLSN